MSDRDLAMLSQALNDRLHTAFNGNAVEGAALQVRQQAATHEVANMRVELSLGWKSSWSQDTGAITPINSKQCADNSDLVKQISDYLNVTINDPAEAKKLEKQYANNFSGLIGFKESKFNVRTLENQWHYYDRCRNCKGNGVVSCNCVGGQQNCSSCGGSGTYSITSVTNYVTGEKETRNFNCGGCWGSGRVTCFICNGTQRLNCRSCDAQGWFTTTFQAEITATLHKSITGIESKLKGFARTLDTLPIEMIADQGDAIQTTSNANSGSVIFDYRVILPYVRHTYCVKTQEFEVHGIGRDILVPQMPPFLDEAIRPVTEQILGQKGNPDRALKAAEGCRVTKEILAVIGRQSKVDANKIAETFYHAVSTETVTRIARPLSTAYNKCGETVIWQIWVKSVIALNFVIAAFVLFDGTGPIIKAMDASDQIQIRFIIIIAVVLLFLFLIWLAARRAALKVVRQIAGPDVTRPPSQGWLPATLAVATIVIAVGLVQYDDPGKSDKAFASSAPLTSPFGSIQSNARTP